MVFPGSASPDGDDLTPWERARVSIELWEKAVDVSTIDCKALGRGGRAGDRDEIERVLRGRRSWAG